MATDRNPDKLTGHYVRMMLMMLMTLMMLYRSVDHLLMRDHPHLEKATKAQPHSELLVI